MQKIPGNIRRGLIAIITVSWLATSSAIAVPATNKLVSNSHSSIRISVPNDHGLKGDLVAVNQRYQDDSIKRYIYVDIAIRLPDVLRGIAVDTAARERLTLTLTRADSATPYAECKLDARRTSKKIAHYALGLKSTGDVALMRWGICDDPALPGHDSIFPDLQPGDKLTLKAPNDVKISQYVFPAAPTNTARATVAKSRPFVAAMESRAYRIRPR